MNRNRSHSGFSMDLTPPSRVTLDPSPRSSSLNDHASSSVELMGHHLLGHSQNTLSPDRLTPSRVSSGSDISTSSSKRQKSQIQNTKRKSSSRISDEAKANTFFQFSHRMISGFCGQLFSPFQRVYRLYLNPFIFHPKSVSLRMWMVFLSLLLLFLLFQLPYNLAFESEGTMIVTHLFILVDIVFCLDIWIKRHTGYMQVITLVLIFLMMIVIV